MYGFDHGMVKFSYPSTFYDLLLRSVARYGKILWKMGDLYNAMWKFEEALALNSTESTLEDLEKVIVR